MFSKIAVSLSVLAILPQALALECYQCANHQEAAEVFHQGTINFVCSEMPRFEVYSYVACHVYVSLFQHEAACFLGLSVHLSPINHNFEQYRAPDISWVKGSVRFVLKFALPPFSPPLPSGVQYRAEGISWVKGSVCFVLKFALPPFSPLDPLWSANCKTKQALNL